MQSLPRRDIAQTPRARFPKSQPRLRMALQNGQSRRCLHARFGVTEPPCRGGSDPHRSNDRCRDLVQNDLAFLHFNMLGGNWWTYLTAYCVIGIRSGHGSSGTRALHTIQLFAATPANRPTFGPAQSLIKLKISMPTDPTTRTITIKDCTGHLAVKMQSACSNPWPFYQGQCSPRYRRRCRSCGRRGHSARVSGSSL